MKDDCSLKPAARSYVRNLRLICGMAMLVVAGAQAQNSRYEGFFLQRAFQNGAPTPSDVYDRAAAQWRSVPRISSGVPAGFRPAAVNGVNGTVWKPIGPSPVRQNYMFSGNPFVSEVNGRVSAIAVNPHNPNVIYQGASGGGVWRTIDGGTTWTPLFDHQPSLGIGEPSAIAIDPSDTATIYVGTSSRFVLNISKGILKTTDGGASWILLGSGFPANNTGNADSLFAGRSISVIIVDPADSNILYLGSTIGLYRSTDGGRNWTRGNNGGGDARTLVLDTTSPANARILFAGVDQNAYPNGMPPIQSNNTGVRRSTDGGQNWVQVLSNGTPVVNAVLAGGGFGQTVLALAPPTSPPNANGIQVLYVTMAGQSGAPDPVGVFESTDQGGTWAPRTSTGMPGNTQGGYNLSMGVDPASPGDGANDIIYFGAVGQAKSTDSGNNFSPMGVGIHVDSHAAWKFALQPSPNPSVVFTGNDGGIWKSLDGGATWSGTGQPGAPATINAGGLQTTLFYNMDVKKDATASVTEGSLQDNGTPRTTGAMAWTDTQGGDGFSIAFDTATPSIAYHTSGFYSQGTCPSPPVIPCSIMFQSTDSGATWIGGCSGWFSQTIPTSEQDCVTSSPGTHPIKVDPTDSKYVYYGGVQDLWQTTTGMGSSFRRISNGFGRPTCLDIAPANPNNVVVGFNGQVWLSTNAKAATVGPPSGVTFGNITRNLPNRNVARVAFDPKDPSVIYAVLVEFGPAGSPQNVWRSTIGGAAWADISPPVNVPVNAIALDGVPTPTTIYVGNDFGVMRSVDGGASWAVLDDIHLPNVPVTDLALNAPAGVLRAATFGRGAFELAAPSGPVIAVNAENGLDFGENCTGKPAYLKIQVFNVGTADLVINSVQRIMGSADFTVLPNPATPLIISPNAEVDFTVKYAPTARGDQKAVIRISSNDPQAPTFDLMATGTRTNPVIATVIADNGGFGPVCVGRHKDLNLTINNNGGCDLYIGNIVIPATTDFQIPLVMSFPLRVEPGNSLQLPIRFEPMSTGFKLAEVIVASNDPNWPLKTNMIFGSAPEGDIRVTGSTDFGDVCAGVLVEKTISICNVGLCDLHVTNVFIVQPCPGFQLINNPFPAVVSHDFCIDLVIRLMPTSCGTKACTLVIESDDLDSGTITLTLASDVLCPEIDVPPDLAFAPEVIQSDGACTTELLFPISNNSQCKLTITSISIGGANAADFSLSGLPSFPIILEPGHLAGEGDLKVVFAPTALDRDREATLTVTYISDPTSGATMSVTRKLCGEGVHTGARVLVTHNGIPIANLEKIHLQRINANRNRDRLDTQDQAMRLPLVTVTPAAPCEPFRYHREYGTIANPIQLLPGSYQITVTAIISGKRQSKTVGFNVETCDFNANIVIDF